MGSQLGILSMKFSMYKRSSLVEQRFSFSSGIWAEQLKKAPYDTQFPTYKRHSFRLTSLPVSSKSDFQRFGQTSNWNKAERVHTLFCFGLSMKNMWLNKYAARSDLGSKLCFSWKNAVANILSSPRAKRAGPKGLRVESARAFTGRRNSHSGRGEDFLSRQPNFFTETALTLERKVEKWFPRWEINRHAEG